MEKERLDYFRRLLLRQMETLLQEAKETLNGMNIEKDNFPDPTDRASYESDQSFILRIRDRERKLINKIKEALERIDNGSFGICEECGGDISEKRLEVRPVTTYCIECKTKEEEKERRQQ